MKGKPHDISWAPAGARAGDTMLYRRWQGMRQYCHDPKHHMFPTYGGRGIGICPEWNSFPVFAAWALAQGWVEPSPDLEISRIDQAGDFSPSNCRLASPRVRANNNVRNVLISAFGEKKSATEWALDPRCAVSAQVIRNRIHQGVEPHRALSLPMRAPCVWKARGRSGYMGVTYHTQTGRWQVMAGDRYLGLYSDPEEAARVYDRAALALWGPFAIVNFPSEHPDPLVALHATRAKS